MTKDQFLDHERLAIFVSAVIAGVAALLWLTLSPLLWVREAWFPFSPSALVNQLDLNWAQLPAVLLAGAESFIFWFTPVPFLLAGFAWTFWTFRREDVLLRIDVELQRSRVEYAAQLEQEAAHWAAFEQSELHGNPAEQLVAIGEYLRSAELARLAGDASGSRVLRCRQMARQLSHSNPTLALELLQQARRLIRDGRAEIGQFNQVLARDLAIYAGIAVAVLLAVPLLVLMAAWIMGLIVWVIKAVITILVLLAVIAAVGASSKKK